MKTVSITIGGRERKLRFGSKAAQDAVDEIQRSGGFQLIPGQRLQIADAANIMLERGDVGIIQTFVRHGLLNPNTTLPDKNLTSDKVYAWIDDHIDPERGAGDLSDFSGPIVRALIAAGLVKAEAVRTAVGDEEARPTLTAVRTTGQESPGE